ncbi:MAG: DUF4388 domain-containing protein [Chitinivibrionales bacterium]|nr:DUF4388 domain-containing protein [Chitinivibrionales bacterium]MBD3357651.1 DUF4388 domain-containing protein [Chitinivibrionales bacterium]
MRHAMKTRRFVSVAVLLTAVFSNILASPYPVVVLRDRGFSQKRIVDQLKESSGPGFTIHEYVGAGSVYRIRKAIERHSPRFVVALEEASAEAYAQYQAIHRLAARIPSIVITTKSVDTARFALENFLNLHAEFPIKRGVKELESLTNKPINRLGIIHLEEDAFRVGVLRDECVSNGIVLRSHALPPDGRNVIANIKKGVHLLKTVHKIQALVVLDDPLLLRTSVVEKGWKPALREFYIPVITDARSLLNAELRVETICLHPDYSSLGRHAARLMDEYKDREVLPRHARKRRALSYVVLSGGRESRVRLAAESAERDHADKRIETALLSSNTKDHTNANTKYNTKAGEKVDTIEIERGGNASEWDETTAERRAAVQPAEHKARPSTEKRPESLLASRKPQRAAISTAAKRKEVVRRRIGNVVDEREAAQKEIAVSRASKRTVDVRRRNPENRRATAYASHSSTVEKRDTSGGGRTGAPVVDTREASAAEANRVGELREAPIAVRWLYNPLAAAGVGAVFLAFLIAFAAAVRGRSSIKNGSAPGDIDVLIVGRKGKKIPLSSISTEKRSLNDFLGKSGYSVRWVTNALRLSKIVEETKPEVICVDCSYKKGIVEKVERLVVGNQLCRGDVLVIYNCSDVSAVKRKSRHAHPIVFGHEFAGDEFLHSIQLALRGSHEPQAYGSTKGKVRNEIQGVIPEDGLSDIFQFIESSQRNGCLIIETTKPIGIVFFEDGRIVSAEYKSLSGTEAVYNILGLRSGSFRFVGNKTPGKRTMNTGVFEAVIGYAQLKDEKLHRLRDNVANHYSGRGSLN